MFRLGTIGSIILDVVIGAYDGYLAIYYTNQHNYGNTVLFSLLTIMFMLFFVADLILVAMNDHDIRIKDRYR